MQNVEIRKFKKVLVANRGEIAIRAAVFRRKSAFAESGQITADSRLQFADRLCRILYARALRGMHNRSDTGPDGRCSDNRSLCPALALPRRKAAVEFREAERAIHFRP